jgi:methylmalonyl-CoA/ethylmalonyl-CoA epimerase
MEEHGEGIHHLGIRVSSLDAALEVMAEEGHELVQMGRGYGIDGDGGFAYFDTEETLGIITEAIEVPAQRRVPDAVFEAEKP